MPFDNASKLSVRPIATQSMIVLDKVELFLNGGTKWARRTYCTGDGKRCLLGAIEYAHSETGIIEDRAVEYLARAINVRQLRNNLPPLGDCDQNTIIGFNDAFRRSFLDITTILSDAKQLAAIDAVVDAVDAVSPNPTEPRLIRSLLNEHECSSVTVE
jgi:hypothetical protein